MRFPDREASPKRRHAGRILPDHWLRAKRFPIPWIFEMGCCICGEGRGYCVRENDREFCLRHRPDLAAAALRSYSTGSGFHAGVYINKNYPDRKTCERILRLAGRTKAPKKPPRGKRRPRDLRYVR